MTALGGVSLARVLGPWRVIRCRVCGGADCLGALHVFRLCNSQRRGPPDTPSCEDLDDSTVPPSADPRQLTFPFLLPARAPP